MHAVYVLYLLHKHDRCYYILSNYIFKFLAVGRIFDGAIDDQFGELGTIRCDGIMERAL